MPETIQIPRAWLEDLFSLNKLLKSKSRFNLLNRRFTIELMVKHIGTVESLLK